jgi:hypothetical protein
LLFVLIFLGAELAGWALCAYLPWLVVSIATHGEAGLGMLALCLFAGVVCAIAVPVLGAQDKVGLWISFPVAAGVSALLLTLRRLTLPVHTPRMTATVKDEQS